MEDEDIDEIAQAIHAVAQSLHRLGTADAATPQGAIELLSGELRKGCERIAESIGDLANAIRETNESE